MAEKKSGNGDGQNRHKSVPRDPQLISDRFIAVLGNFGEGAFIPLSDEILGAFERRYGHLSSGERMKAYVKDYSLASEGRLMNPRGLYTPQAEAEHFRRIEQAHEQQYFDFSKTDSKDSRSHAYA